MKKPNKEHRIPSEYRHWTYARTPKDMEIAPCERWLTGWFPVVAVPSTRMVDEGLRAFVEYNSKWDSIAPGVIYVTEEYLNENYIKK